MDTIEKLVALLERFVAAQEKAAVAAELQAKNVEQIAEMCRRSEAHFLHIVEHQPWNSVT